MTEKKKKGIIRTGAVLPLVSFILIITAFNILFLDYSIKKAIEITGEIANKAEVNVTDVTTSFSDLSLKIKKVEFTDRDNPEFNKFEVGAIEASVLGDALLRAKIVINNVDIKDIKIQTKRAKRGFVVEDEASVSAENKKVKEILNKTKQSNKKNVLGDVAGVLDGGSTGNIPKDIESDLESKKKFKALEQKADQTSDDVNKEIKSLPSESELAEIQKRISKVDWGSLTNPKKAKKTLDEINDIKKDIDKVNKRISKVRKTINKKTNELENEYKLAEKSVDDDINAVSKRMNLPEIDQKAIAKSLFGDDVVGKMDEFQRYYFMAKKYFPPKKKENDKEAPLPRASGRDYRFGAPNSYPLLWVKAIKINSENEQGYLKGEILDITSNQKLINKYTTANLEGDFPAKNVRNFNANAVLDFKDSQSLKLRSSIGSVPVRDKKLVDSKETSFIIKKASNKVDIKADLKVKGPKLSIKNSMTNLEIDAGAKSKQLNEILSDVSTRTKLITLDALGSGSWDSIQFDIRSNLAAAIQNSISSLVQEKIDKKKAEIRKKVEAQVAESKKKITAQVDSVKNSAQKAIKSGEAQLKKLTKSMDKKKKKGSSKDLLKGFKL